MTAWLAFPGVLFMGSLAFTAALVAIESARPRPTKPDPERDYSWSDSPIHDALLAERLRAELEADDAVTRLGGAL